MERAPENDIDVVPHPMRVLTDAVAEAKERLETQAAAERVARRASLAQEADAVEETLGGGE